jgi:hypothetical protein
MDPKFEVLGPIHHGRKPAHEQPSRDALRAFHREHQAMLNHEVFWLDEARQTRVGRALGEAIGARGYTCYAAAVCCNHAHAVIRTHRDRAPEQWKHIGAAIVSALRPEFPPEHPILSDRPYKVFPIHA